MINTNYNHSSTSRSSGHQEGRASSGESSSAAMGGGGTPNPLAGGMPPSAPAPGPSAPMPGHHHHQQYPQPQYPQQQYPQQHAQQHHYPHQCPHPSSAPGPTAHPPPPTGQFAPSSTAPSASSSVPNPILGVAPAAASMPGIFHSPITVPKPHHPAQQFPSPLASPRMTFATAPATATAATAIAATATTAATTATTNINYNHNSNNTHESTSSGPPTNRQRRSNNTIQWEQHRNSSTNDYTHTSSESLEPVNFGTASSRKAPQFSSSNPNNNNNNNSSNINSNSNISNNNMMNIRTASSGSLASYTSYASFPSCDASHDDSATSNTNYQGSPNSKSSGANNYNNSTSATAPNSATATTAATSSNAAASSKNKNSTTTTTTTTNSKPTKAPPDKRLKRLERNRESARLSRRRRKHYLEELEVKVTSMSEEMDSGRITHASMAVKTLRSMRLAKLMEVERLLFGSGGVGGSAGVSLDGIGGGIGYAPLFVGSSGSSSVGVNNPLANSGGVYNNNSNNQSNNNNNQSNNNNNNNSNNNNNHNKQQQKPPPLPIVSCNNASSTISSISKPLLEQHLRPLQTNLCRTNNELQIVNLFLKQQLMSMVQPMASKFVLWLTLQNDGFYRGGRAASERLSAARIGERLLHNGTYRASPSDGMWPLICHEISLSYDQEDKIRQCQRSILGNSASWINRHTAAATKNMIDSIDATISGMHETAKRRERSMLSVLTVEQRVAFLAWAARRGPAIRRIAAQKVGIMPDDGEAGKWKASPDRHVAANMYITDHHLAKVKQHLPPTTRFVNNPAKLKKLSRRPSFESLAGQDTDSNPKLNHDSSFPSTGSLKRSLGDVMGEDLNDQNEMQTGHTSHSSVTPESAQLAAQAAVNAALRDVLPIIPKTSFQYSHHQQYRPYAPVTSHHPQLSPMFKSNPTHLPQAVVSNHNMPQPIIHHPTPATSVNVPDPIDDIPMPTPVSVLLRTADEFITPYGTSSSTQSYSAVPEPVASCIASKFSNQHQSAPQLSQHADYPSILPAPMGMIPVPEEGALAINPLQENDDFFLEDFHMGADDWAIGEGFDMDIEEGAQMM